MPERADVVWITLNPQLGREQAGRRPALVLSPTTYNSRARLVIVCPVTNQVKGYPFEVRIPEGLPVSGVVLADQVKSVDWQAREAAFICRVPVTVLQEVRQKLDRLLS